MPTNQQIAAEVGSDPAGLGYAAAVAAKNDQAVADLMNAAGAGAPYSVYRKAVPVRELIAAITPVDFTALTAAQVAQLDFLFQGTATLDATDANARTIVQAIFTGKTATLAAFAVVAKKQGSRAEVLWGEGALVTANQVAAALGRP